MSKFKRHFFVCQVQRPAFMKPSCGAQGAIDMFTKMQEALAQHPELWSEVTVTPSGCLSNCFDGPSMVVYPEGFWYAHVKAGDVQEIIETHMLGGKPVDRLRYEWPQ
jgi:(2Fe-2S) ferredoxin